jgi:hypothetical protein
VWRHRACPRAERRLQRDGGLEVLGALDGYWIFAGLFGHADDDKLDWGGIVGPMIGAVIVVALASWLIKRTRRGRLA